MAGDALTTPDTLEQLVMKRNVVITVGAGGVGKTTTAAALAVAAASRGRRVLCLTIDPARRLAESLGLETMSSDEQVVDPSRFRAAGIPFEGSLTAAMLDTKRTFDELVVKYSSSPERAKRLLNNRLYQHVSTSLAGTQEYMATEKLVAVQRSGLYDLIVLDTPPTANALDFLDAPQRLVEALDSPTLRWILQAFQSTGKLSLNLIARSATIVLQAIARITGAGFLQDMAQFITELNDLFGGFKVRAQEIQGALRGPDVTFVLVTSPAPMSIQEVLYFSQRLEQARMSRGAFVVNRFRLPPSSGPQPPTREEADAALRAHHVALNDAAFARITRAYEDAVKLAALDALHVQKLAARAEKQVPIVRVPEMASDIHDVAGLHRVAEVLMRGAPGRPDDVTHGGL